MTPALRARARSWVADCVWADLETDDLTDAALRAGIERHYDGGWAGFLADCE